MTEQGIEGYLKERVDNQLDYFDASAIRNQKAYKRLKTTAISCNILTTMTIAIAFTVPQEYKVLMGILALILSTIVLATYQIEEFQSFGSKWERFRLVAEQLKSEKLMFLNQAGPYSTEDEVNRKKLLVETVESIIRGTDISYFTIVGDPSKRIEKRLHHK